MSHTASFSLKHTKDSCSDPETAKELIQELLDEIEADLVEDPEYKEEHACFDFQCQSDIPFDYYGIVESWCGEREYRGWCSIRKESNITLPYHSHVLTEISELSIGNFPNVSLYMKHVELKPENCKRMLISFENDVQKVTCFILTTEEWYKLEFEFRSVEGFVVGDLFSEEFTVYLPIRNPPKIWCASVQKIKSQEHFLRNNRAEQTEHMNDQEFEDEMIRTTFFDRHNKVGTCDPKRLGSCSVFQFCIQTTEDDKEKENHKRVIAGFLKHGYTFYFSAIDPNGKSSYKSNTVDRLLRSVPSHLKSPRNLFAVRYAIMILLSAGTRLTDHLTLGEPVYNTVQSLISSLKNEEDIVPLTKTFALLCLELDKRRFLDIADRLTKLFELQKEAYYEKDLILQKQKNFRLVRRVTITPTRVLFQPPELNATNRVLRKYGEDNFVRLNLRDEDLGPLNIGGDDHVTDDNAIVKRVSDFFHNGILMGDQSRCYQFLGCSNSQLRSAGAWFVYEDEEITVEALRSWIGDFSKERSKAKFLTRMGQAFTTTESLMIDTAKEYQIEDILTDDGRYTFSDGIGKISLSVARAIKENQETLEHLPSAFQIRYGGCKGMVALDPTLGETEKIIQIRPSMNKFKSNHKDIEYIKSSKPSQLYMNRQVIWLLMGYGIPKQEFINLQNDTLISLAQSLVSPDQASTNLMNYQGNGVFQQVLDSNIDLTQEPFHRAQLLSLYRFHVKEVLTRTRIVMAADGGRQMFGVMDETGTLEYGQVFVQYSERIPAPGAKKIIKKGRIFITKNPCVHPGDLRTFTAVDVPALHHMCDVVVFPAKGPRPHPNELSGSDLDGDEYFVCWIPALTPRVENKPAGSYEGGETQKEPSPVTPVQIIDHVIKHMTKPNNLGKISNAHQVHCDKDSVDCDKAVRLAEQHSIAVDYPKTGIPEDFSRDLRVHEYPDWMEKPDKPCYISHSVVGNCYRICRSLDHVLGEQDPLFDPTKAIELDPRLIVNRNNLALYLDAAVVTCNDYNKELSTLMLQYGLTSEGDIACGCLNTVKQQLDKNRQKNYDITEECVRFYWNLQKKYQKIFFEEFGTRKGEWKENYAVECFCKASAWYLAAYKYAPPTQIGRGLRLLSFPWCVGEVLCELARERETEGERTSCTEQTVANMERWLAEQTGPVAREPPETFTEIRDGIDSYADEFNLRHIPPESYGLPFSTNELCYISMLDKKSNPLSALQQKMFLEHSNWDNIHVEMKKNLSEQYLIVQGTTNVVVFTSIEMLEKMYTLRCYLEQYPALRLPTAVVLHWVYANKLHEEANHIALDFALLFVLSRLMEKKEVKIEVERSKDREFYLNRLKQMFPSSAEVDNSGACEIYLGFLKSIIYGKVSGNQSLMTWLPPNVKNLTMSLCAYISSYSIKFVSYAMREYHETCYFLFNQSRITNNRKWVKRNKFAKYKVHHCYPICCDTDLCSRYLTKVSKTEVNMRVISDKKVEILVIEAWGSKPEVLQDVTESLQIETDTIFDRRGKLINDSHCIYINGIQQKKDDWVEYRVLNGEGYFNKHQINKILDLRDFTAMKHSAETKVLEWIDTLRKHYRRFSHGYLSAKCVFGRFKDFRNCLEKEKDQIKYENTMTFRGNDEGRFTKNLINEGFREEETIRRFRIKMVHGDVPITTHWSLTPDGEVVFERLSWCPLVWGEMHAFVGTESPQDSIFSISSEPSLTQEDLDKTQRWGTIPAKIKSWLQISLKDGLRVGLNAEGRNRVYSTKSFCQIIAETVTIWKIPSTATARLQKMQVEFIKRTRDTLRFHAKSQAMKPNAPWKGCVVEAALPHFDKYSTGLLKEFYDKCMTIA